MNAPMPTPDMDKASPLQPDEPVQLEARVIAPDQWDALAVEFRDVLHEQTQCFNALRWAPEQLERVAFYLDGKLASLACVLIMKFPVVGSGIAVVKWGPLWRHKSTADNPAILHATIDRLKDIYAEDRGLYLTFFPRADPDISPTETEAFEACGFHTGEELSSPDRYFVKTGLPLDELRASLAQKWRYNLKKAEKNGLTSRFVEGEEGMGTFMQLYESMLDRKSFHDTSAIDTLSELIKAKEKSLRPLILLVEHEGEAVAGGVIDASGARAIYLYGATNSKALPLKAGYVMHWAIATHLANDPDNEWYDLGGADQDCHLHQFKRGFVGKAGVTAITPRYYHFGANLKARFLGSMLFTARRKKGELARLLHDLRHKGFKSLLSQQGNAQ